MKKFVFILCVMASVVCANAKILRVSNVNGSGAPYSTVKDALEAAEDGDVIMVDASPNSYGDIDINKKVTLQGPGYWLIDNEIVQDGPQTAEFGEISIITSEAKLSSVYAYQINCNANRCIATRCRTDRIYIAEGIQGVIIHQNYISTGVFGPSYIYTPQGEPSYIQITNNIICADDKNITSMRNSIVKYNTFRNCCPWNMEGCLFERNIGVRGTERDNTYTDNYNNTDWHKTGNDTDYKNQDALMTTEHGAFAGEDPYVISGIASGPYIEDIYVPVSVTKGDDMQVKVKIGVAR